MGCDIHLYSEYRDKKGKWFSADHFSVDPYIENELNYELVSIYDWRNYELFGTLANVRNYSDNECISDPRGLPCDMSLATKKGYEFWGCDAHSCSWLTAAEIFDWKKSHSFVKHSGFISQEDSARLDAYGELPTTWCQWTSDKTCVYREWTSEFHVLDSLINAIKDRMKEVFHIYDFYSDSEKENLIQANAENFRIIFWFDN